MMAQMAAVGGEKGSDEVHDELIHVMEGYIHSEHQTNNFNAILENVARLFSQRT